MSRIGTVCQAGSSRIAARLSPTKITQAMSTQDERSRPSARRRRIVIGALPLPLTVVVGSAATSSPGFAQQLAWASTSVMRARSQGNPALPSIVPPTTGILLLQRVRGNTRFRGAATRPGRLATVGWGEGNVEAGAVAGALAVSVDLAAVGVDDRAGDGEPDAAAAGGGVGASAVDAVEALEDALQQLGRDALTSVAHRDPHLAVGEAGGGDLDAAAGWGVAQRVAEQVGQHLTDAVRVGRHLRQTRVELGGKRDVLGGVGSLGGLDRGNDQLVGLAAGRVEVELAFLGAGDDVEVVNQPAQAGRLGLEHL